MAPASGNRQRLRYGKLAAPSECADLYWGVNQPELADLTDARLTFLLLSSPEFEHVLGPKLDEIDWRNRTVGKGKKMGRPARWSARQLESVLLYRRVAGLESIKRTLERLHWDREALELLDLGERLPSRATLTRHQRQHFAKHERAQAYRELDRQLRQRVVQLPGFDQEARILGMDGSQHGTHFTAPIPERDNDGEYTGKFVNAGIEPGQPRAITAPTAGYVGGHGPKSGTGWQMVGVFTEHGTLVAWDISPVNEGERAAAARALEAYEREVLPFRDPETISVLTADGGFSSPLLRSRLQELRVVPNIHKASHKADANTGTSRARQLNDSWRVFQHPGKPHYSNWRANGHGEIRCDCGQAQLKSDIRASKSGYLTIATKGNCSNCGNVTITAGKWHSAQNPKRWVHSNEGESDLSVGNPLTFNDQLAKAYGADRFGFGESVHATIRRRFGMLKDESWMRDINEVEAEFAVAASAISVLLLERCQRQNGNGTEFDTEPAADRDLDPADAEMPVAA